MTALVVVAAVAAALAAVTSAATAVKEYTATISPTSVGAGTTAPPPTFTLSFTNSASSTHSLGGAKATFPAAFTSVGVVSGSVVAPSGKTWVAVASGNTIELHAQNGTTDPIAAGQTVSVDVTFTAPCAVDGYGLVTAAVQDNKFNGPPGNKFKLVQGASDPTLTVVPDPAVDHFAFSTISDPETAGAPFGVTITAVDACGNTVTSFNGSVGLSGVASVDYSFTGAGDTTADTSVTLSGGVVTTSVRTTAVQSDVQIVANGDPDSASNTFDVVAGPAAALRIDAIPDADPPQQGIQQVKGAPFAVHVTTYDAFGNANAAVTTATSVQLTVKTGTGATGTSPVSIPAGGTGGASFSVAYTVSEYGVVLTASVTAGDSLTPDDSDAFDVLDSLVTEETTPGQNATLTTATGAKCSTDAINTTCVTVVLPNGASQTVSLSEANCDDNVDFPDGSPSSACIGNLLGFFGDVKDASGNPLYGTGKPGELAPFKIITEFDTTISGGTGAPKVDMFFSIADAASGDPIYGQSFRCSKKGVVDDGRANSDLDGDGLVDPEDFFCNEAETRQNDGDTLITTLMWVDINGKGR